MTNDQPDDGRRHDVILRDATPDDALCISVLAIQVFLDTYASRGIRPLIAREALSLSQPVFAQFIEDRQARMVVAELDGHLIGFAQIRLGARHPLVPAACQAELLRLYVQEPFTGSAVGTRLLGRAEAIAAGSGATTLWLTAWARNRRALGFYASRGYCDHGLAWYTFEDESHENRVLAKAWPRGSP